MSNGGFLHDPASGELFEFQVKWRQGTTMGLFFIDVCSRAARRKLIQRHTDGS